MSGRSIILRAPEVLALLAGKTQLRRAVKTPRWAEPGTIESDGSTDGFAAVARVSGCLASVTCPYGDPGDTRWVKETWVKLLAVSPATDEPMEITDGERLIEAPTFHEDAQGRKRWNYDGTVIAYGANSNVEFCDGDGFMGEFADKRDMPRWRSAVHMPREFSRLTLRIVGVRTERDGDGWTWVLDVERVSEVPS